MGYPKCRKELNLEVLDRPMEISNRYLKLLWLRCWEKVVGMALMASAKASFSFAEEW